MNFDDQAVLDAHQLAAGDVEMPALTFAGCVLDGDDVLIADRYVDQASAERATRERRELCEELVPDGLPALMATGDRTATGQDPYGVRSKAGASRVEVVIGERLIEPPNNLGVCVFAQPGQIIAREPGPRHPGWRGLVAV